ncbi:MAG: hypothetical protein KAX05_09030, partial [Bacteroidales bacterium]|nr:hypothetical protein [Bacteroidales bacterium]
ETEYTHWYQPILIIHVAVFRERLPLAGISFKFQAAGWHPFGTFFPARTYRSVRAGTIPL